MSIHSKGVKSYKTKVVVEQAILLTKDNLEDAAKWCGGIVVKEAKPSDPSDIHVCIKFPTLDGLAQADVDYFIVKGNDGRFRKVSSTEYLQTMEEFVTRDQGIRLGTA